MTDTMQTSKGTMQERLTDSLLGQYLAKGELVRLRGVQEQDLTRLAQLMAEAPLLDENPQPWTAQRLRKQFEDEKEPGLWGRTTRVFSVVDAGGEVVGFIKDYNRPPNFRVFFHVEDNNERRDETGRDLLAAYMRMLRDWSDPVRVEVQILAVETEKAAWLAEQGFKLDVTVDEAFMYRGEAVGWQFWGWVNPRVLEE